MTGGYMFKRKVYNELLEWKENMQIGQLVY